MLAGNVSVQLWASAPIPQNIHRVEGLLHVKSVEFQSPDVDVVSNNTRAISDEPRNFEPRSSDEDISALVPKPPPNYHTTPKGGLRGHDRFYVHQPIYTAFLQSHKTRIHAPLTANS
ncbi:hypothetical protein TNCV_1133611 [Trichonephila clavipes]|nr:hypothetical protein TNCV_1133611 [Trichonephila clavipes]